MSRVDQLVKLDHLSLELENTLRVQLFVFGLIHEGIFRVSWQLVLSYPLTFTATRDIKKKKTDWISQSY